MPQTTQLSELSHSECTQVVTYSRKLGTAGPQAHACSSGTSAFLSDGTSLSAGTPGSLPFLLYVNELIQEAFFGVWPLYSMLSL